MSHLEKVLKEITSTKKSLEETIDNIYKTKKETFSDELDHSLYNSKKFSKYLLEDVKTHIDECIIKIISEKEKNNLYRKIKDAFFQKGENLKENVLMSYINQCDKDKVFQYLLSNIDSINLKKYYEYWIKIDKSFKSSMKSSYKIENPAVSDYSVNKETKKLLRISNKLKDYFFETKLKPKISTLIYILSEVSDKSVLRSDYSSLVLINEGKYIPPFGYNAIESELKRFESEILTEEMDPIMKAMHMHYQFVRIHPFKDGNGRSARLLSNSFLYVNRVFPITITEGEKWIYASLLDNACYSRKQKEEGIGLHSLRELTSEENVLFTYLASKINNEYIKKSRALKNKK